jgi:acetyl esterase/lipase
MISFLKIRIGLSLNSLFILAWLCCTIDSSGQQKVIALYNGPAPGSENWNWEEKEFFVKTPLNANVAYNVSKPTLTVFTPDSANGAAIIICPGGALRVLNIETEGSIIAKELNKKGITAFVLRYRLMRSITDDPWQETINSLKDTAKFRADNGSVVRQMVREDATTAMKYVREHAAEYKIDESRIGVIGFSAGGSLAVRLSLNEKPEARPAFVAFIYSVFNPSAYPAVPPNAPPAFIACATDDVLAASTNSAALYNAWIASKNSAELHIYTKGGHGLRGSVAAKNWINRFIEWLDELGMFSPRLK